MMPTRRPRFRALVVLLRLAANLIAVCAPVLHKLHKQEAHHDHHNGMPGACVGFKPGGNRPSLVRCLSAGLHNDARLLKCGVVAFAIPAPVAPVLPELVEVEAEYLSEPPGSL